MDFRDFLKNNTVVLDGGMGTLLQAQGLTPGEYPERLNLTDPELITSIHRRYYEAGSNVVLTNTFGANPLKFGDDELDAVIGAGIDCAKRARASLPGGTERFVALDVGPTGKLLAPLGELDFEEAVGAFARVVRSAVKHGVDLVMIETMNDSYETKAALLAVKENCDLPVIVSNAYGEDGKLMTGASPAAMVALLEGMGADAIGVNCSFGPDALAPVVEEYLEYSSLPVVMKPNAGLPQMVDGKTVYDVTAKEFAASVGALAAKGVRVVGGCCGTTPEHIRELAAVLPSSPVEIEAKERTVTSSYSRAVVFGDRPVLIGERINPTGKKRFKQAIEEHDMTYILGEAIKQQENGAHVLDVNVGLPGIDEAAFLCETVKELQAVTDLPLQIDTADPAAMERALRVYNGKAVVNSVNGKRESMDAIFPLVKKYGGAVVALTLDEDGIPATAEGRVAIAEKILAAAAEYGVPKRDVIFDALTMTVSADADAAKVTLEALRRIKNELGCRTSLGVSNVSFGLPARDAVNSVFFAAALTSGLDAAILNVNSAEMMKTYRAYCALSALDENFGEYISFASGLNLAAAIDPAKASPRPEDTGATDLRRAIVKGLKSLAADLAKEKLAATDPIEIINGDVVPALDEVGRGFEAKTTFLPQLLMSAEAASAAFEVIKAAMPAGKGKSKCRFVIATVLGDIHDIGKNIVKLLLENYGFDVIDLGRDVPPEAVLEAARSSGAPIVGLSALMTTTVPAMEATVKLLKKELPDCKVVVGGAVLNRDYAEAMHADFYAKDAMDTVRYADKINDRLK